MNSIRITNINLHNKDDSKLNAYVYSLKHDLNNTQNRLNKFINLINSCEIKTTQCNQLPENYLWQQYNLFCIDLGDQQISSSIPDQIQKLALKVKVIFFNVKKDVLDEMAVLLAGVSGIFYQDDRPDIIIKGLENIKNDGLWFKRSIMDKALLGFLHKSKFELSQHENLAEFTTDKHKSAQSEVNSKTLVDSISPTKLTKREKMITQLVARGAQNKEIADTLHISPNTVKTHIYSIFRKTNSRNRIELLTWTQQFAFVD